MSQLHFLYSCKSKQHFAHPIPASSAPIFPVCTLPLLSAPAISRLFRRLVVNVVLVTDFIVFILRIDRDGRLKQFINLGYWAAAFCRGLVPGIVRGSLNRIVTTKAPIAQIDELFEPPISIYSEYEDNEVSDKDRIDDQAQILELISTILSPP